MGRLTARRALYFTAKRRVEVREEPFPGPKEGEMLIETLVSAISPGTELLIFRGEAPPWMEADESLKSLGGNLEFPLKYGYCAVGRVVELGDGVDGEWTGRTVFSFQPHQSRFTASTRDLLPLPEGIEPDEAVFLPNVETAVNLVLDGAPLLGERVAVVGQGTVGLLATALLSRFPLEKLLTLDPLPNRREMSLRLGAHESREPSSPLPDDLDLVFELSGNPAALDTAIGLCGFSGRIVVGSWYGMKRAPLDLGGRFHRRRLKIVGSQVSTVAPELSGRWTRERRIGEAWRHLRAIEPSRLITGRFPLDRAQLAYEAMDESPDRHIQAVLTYGQEGT